MARTLGQQIRHARIELGINQQELRARVRLSQKYLSDIEQDKVDPRWSVVKRLADSLDVSLDYLADRDKEHVA